MQNCINFIQTAEKYFSSATLLKDNIKWNEYTNCQMGKASLLVCLKNQYFTWTQTPSVSLLKLWMIRKNIETDKVLENLFFYLTFVFQPRTQSIPCFYILSNMSSFTIRICASKIGIAVQCIVLTFPTYRNDKPDELYVT